MVQTATRVVADPNSLVSSRNLVYLVKLLLANLLNSLLWSAWDIEDRIVNGIVHAASQFEQSGERNRCKFPQFLSKCVCLMPE